MNLKVHEGLRVIGDSEFKCSAGHEPTTGQRSATPPAEDSDDFSLSLRSFSMYTPVTTIRSTMSFPAAYISSELGGELLIIPHRRRWKRATGVLAESFTKSYDPGQCSSVCFFRTGVPALQLFESNLQKYSLPSGPVKMRSLNVMAETLRL